MNKNVIITGSTGMIGKGVLYESLEDKRIDKVLIINRRSLGMKHPKLNEEILEDFSRIDQLKEKLIGYDACFYCMGVSAVGMNEEKYTAITYETTKIFADTLYTINPGMTFNYVSGAGTDSSEKGNSMWARVKGKAENYILAKHFGKAYMFRPGAIIPEKGIRSRTRMYNIIYAVIRPFFGLMKKSKHITTTTKIGKAMINSLFHIQELTHFENKDINTLSEL